MKKNLIVIEGMVFVALAAIVYWHWPRKIEPTISDRSPASTAISRDHRVLDLGCLNTNERHLNVKADNVLLVARICDDNDSLMRAEGWNATRRSMIFCKAESANKELTTNYVPLARGENRLQIDYMTNRSHGGRLEVFVNNLD